MAPPRPELIFVSGIQEGERAVLMANVAIAGRGSSCEVNLKEESISRQQIQFEFSPDGWVVENLSVNGTWINGKKYKAGKKVILETGDVLKAGADTQILFVSPGDDPEEALKQYRQKHSVAAPKPREETDVSEEPVPAAAPKASSEPTSVGSTRDMRMQASVGAGSSYSPDKSGGKQELSDEAKERQVVKERTAKLKKYGMYFVVYMVVLFGVVIGISQRGCDHGEGVRSIPRKLTGDDISAAILSKLLRSPNPVVAQQNLKEAISLYPRRNAEPGFLYIVVSDLNEYLSHKDGPAVFEAAEYDQMYKASTQELADAVTAEYNRAFILEQNKQWKDASNQYNKVWKMLPEKNSNSRVYKEIIQNIQDHISFIAAQSRARQS